MYSRDELHKSLETSRILMEGRAQRNVPTWDDRLAWWLYHLQSGFRRGGLLREDCEHTKGLPFCDGEIELCGLQALGAVRATGISMTLTRQVCANTTYNGKGKREKERQFAECVRICAPGPVVVHAHLVLDCGWAPGPEFAQWLHRFVPRYEEPTGEQWCGCRETNSRVCGCVGERWTEYHCVECGAAVPCGSGPHRKDRDQSCACSGCTWLLDSLPAIREAVYGDDGCGPYGWRTPEGRRCSVLLSRVADSAALRCIARFSWGVREYEPLFRLGRILEKS